jgi:RNA polymerase sigma factor (sigma-70 family)
VEPSSSEEDRNYAQLEAIFRAHVADLYRYIYRQVHQAVIAEDLTSSVFLKALRWLQQDRSPESVKGWLYATARSLIADYWREQTQINLLPLETAEEIPALSPESNEEQLQLLQTSIQRLLDGLPSRERAVLTLRYFQGYSAAEIGQALGISAKYVRVLQLRALRHAASLETTERIVPMESPAIPYNQQALRVLELTKEEARALNHNYIGTEHLLLGIFDEGSAATELINHGITAERIRGAILFIIGRLPAQPGYTPTADYTPRTQAIFVLAAEEARRMGETAISPHHLLVAILREGEGIAAGVLQASDVRLEQVGDAVRIIISPEPDEEEGPVTIPADLQEALLQHPDAHSLFVKLPNSKQKKVVDVIEQAEGEDARKQRIETVIKQIARAGQWRRQGQQ